MYGSLDGLCRIAAMAIITEGSPFPNVGLIDTALLIS